MESNVILSEKSSVEYDDKVFKAIEEFVSSGLFARGSIETEHAHGPFGEVGRIQSVKILVFIQEPECDPCEELKKFFRDLTQYPDVPDWPW